MGAQAAAVLAGGTPVGVVPSQLAARTALSLGPVPDRLIFDRVARSHGWCALPPFGYDPVSQRLHRVLSLPSGPAPVWVSADFTVSSGSRLAARDQKSATSQLRWVLGLDDDVDGAPAPVTSTRLLRSPTVWEDLVKTLLTTNTSWTATVGMVTRLVETLGAAGAFPDPSAVLAAGIAHLTSEVRVGYRASALQELAMLVEAGDLDPQAWRDPALSDEDVVAAVLALRGFGPYAAEGMLGLLGRPRGLAVDSWIRARLGGLTAPQVREKYAAHGRWAGAVLWQDVTADWFT